MSYLPEYSTSLVEKRMPAGCGYSPVVYYRRTAGPGGTSPDTTSYQYRYQTQKRIWKTAGVAQSDRTHNIAAMSIFRRSGPLGVNWNQMSDQPEPAGHARTKGVDVKHGSYARYLLRIQSDPLKRGVQQFIPADLPPNSGIHGGKMVKTGIVTGESCVCN